MNIVWMDEINNWKSEDIEKMEENKIYKGFYLTHKFEDNYGKCEVYKNKKGITISSITTKSFKTFEELNPDLKEVIERLKGRKYE